MTKAGGTETYFGKADRVPYADARRAFADHLKNLADHRRIRRAALSAEVLCDLHLDWLHKERSPALYKQRQYLLSKWCDFTIGKGANRLAIADVAAAHVTGDDLLAWKQHLRDQGLGQTTIQHALAAVKSCWYWGAAHAHLPDDFRPFKNVAKIKITPPALTEDQLLTPAERDLLFHWADADLGKIRDPKTGKYRKRHVAEYRPAGQNPYSGFADLLRCYYHTGARTSELAGAAVKDLQVRSRTLVLRNHKRSRTLNEPEVRQIVLNEAAFAVLGRHCQGKPPEAPIFTQGNGRPWHKDALDARFRKVRALAGVRPVITLYDFRHLWISEALMAGVDVFTVAKMAGTSVKMIEQTYGHLRGSHLEEAQRCLDQARDTARKCQAG
jgi:integrase